ncbi:DUF6154 family protein [Peribacillus deserti]|uniref:Cytosolic protein n=1 Tax=Peribacillus deserti TaxID=673318 RepID=A0A2N5M4L6_9BACI|nr:DUF6154 family protein [Peribacillus deserti]PLT29297.1 hypothetical protein CUU66_14130 [Peribacillus deserti]
MKLIEELYELYKSKLTGNDEDIDMLAFAVLEQLSREEILGLIHEMDNQELINLMGLYIIESLKGKFAQENFEKHLPYPSRNVH